MGRGRSHSGGGGGGGTPTGVSDEQMVQEAVNATYAKFGTKESKEELDRMWKDFKERVYGTLADNDEIDRYTDIPKGLSSVGDTLETEASWYTLLYKDGSHVNVHEGELMVDGEYYPLRRLSLKEKPVYIYNEEISGSNDSLGYNNYYSGYNSHLSTYNPYDRYGEDRLVDYDGGIDSDYLNAITKRINPNKGNNQRHLKKGE